MFEDATFDARGAVRNHARQWMMLTAVMQTAIVAGLVVAPLVTLHKLPNVFMTPRALYAPQPVKLPEQIVQQRWARPVIALMPINNVVTQIPKERLGNTPAPDESNWKEVGISPGEGVGAMQSGIAVFRSGQAGHVVQGGTQAATRVSGGVVEGLLLPHATPSYPQIARTAGIGGEVVLAATISAQGRIENLRVISGHPLLRDAAIVAVKEWRYRPYLLDGKAVEVETTITIRFTLGH
jgi:protein TonB